MATDEVLGRFGLREFRPGQREVIDSVLAGRNVLCVMPTGGGKSLCYQLPALLLPGVTLVISPLIALMKDQEDQLVRRNIRATSLHSNLSLAEQEERLDGIGQRRYDLVYVAPERFRSRRFLEMVGNVGLSLLAVDEAHCISEWGHDFRPDYARLGFIRQRLGNPTTIALTATATDIVRRDILDQLHLKDPAVFVRGFDRPNLRYSVRAARSNSQKQDYLRQLLGEIDGSIIVYAASRKSCEEVASFIRDRTNRTAAVYHAGLPPDERRLAQDAFMSGRKDIVVATNAFGMGIDKPDIRGVIHYNLPGTIEAYYQEAGRAGRDGEPAVCELLFSSSDRIIQEYFIENEYPDRKVVYQVLDFIRRQEGELVELTREEIRLRLGGTVSEMAVGAAIKLLESAGAVERLRPRQNMAIVRVHENGPDLTDLVPSAAASQRKVLRFLEGLVGDQRGADVYFNPGLAADALDIERSGFVRVLHDLTERLKIEYIPPFRGSATRVLDRDTPVEEVPIDFEELETRKRNEYEKLDRVFEYAQAPGCRRQKLLAYFGDTVESCGNCDGCNHAPPRSKTKPQNGVLPAARLVASDGVTELFRTILAGVSEFRGRFGKNLVAQALTGSQAKAVTRFGLQKREHFNALAGWQQAPVVEMLDALLLAGLIEQQGDRFRPTIVLTARGADVISRKAELPSNLPLSGELWAKLEQMVGAKPASVPPPPDRPAATPLADDRRPVAVPKPSPTAASAIKAAKSEPSYYWTWRLIDAGFRLPEIVAIRGLTNEQVIDEAIAALQNGHSISLNAFHDLEFNPAAQSKLDRLRKMLDGNRSTPTK